MLLYWACIGVQLWTKADRASKLSSFGCLFRRIFFLPLDEEDLDMLVEFSSFDAVSLCTASWKSAKILSRAALYCASRSSRVSLDLSRLGVLSAGDVKPSSLRPSTPFSEVDLDGADELGVVLFPVEKCRLPSCSRRIIFIAAAAGTVLLPDCADLTSCASGVGGNL